MEVFARLRVHSMATGELIEQVGAVINCPKCETLDEFERHHDDAVKEYLEDKLELVGVEEGDDTDCVVTIDYVELEEPGELDKLYTARVGYSEDDSDEE